MKSSSPKFRTGQAIGTKTILVVEDEATVRIFVHQVFEEQGNRELSAPSAVEAKEIFEKNRWEVALFKGYWVS